jgi:hypothetical protein
LFEALARGNNRKLHFKFLQLIRRVFGLFEHSLAFSGRKDKRMCLCIP